MNYREYPPPPSLRRFIRCLWTIEETERDTSTSAVTAEPSPNVESVLPDGCAELIVHYGDPFKLHDPNGRASVQPHAIVAGTIRSAIRLEPTGRVGIIAARFHPFAAANLLRDASYHFVDRLVPLDVIAAGESDPLFDRIAKASTRAERIAHLVSFLEHHLTGRGSVSRRADATARTIAAAVREVNISEGDARLPDLCSRLALSRRTFERRFREAVGLSPKVYARIVRFQTAVRAAESTPSLSLAAIAATAGYYDQAHFHRDFRAFAGESPAVFFATRHDLSASLTTSPTGP